MQEALVNNYGVLRFVFDDGSVGWCEAGWGPMTSEAAFSSRPTNVERERLAPPPVNLSVRLPSNP
jgi:hypothetical protein